jgi:hypothetical protein
LIRQDTIRKATGRPQSGVLASAFDDAEAVNKIKNLNIKYLLIFT